MGGDFLKKAVSWMETARRGDVGSYGQILRLAGPLILSSTSVMLMNVVDGLFLARYDTKAIAAVGPAGLFFWTLLGLFLGLCGYTNTFVAQYVGAGRPERVGAAVWQGLYIGLGAGLALGALAGPVSGFFFHLGHPAEVAALESEYFRILAWFSVLYLVGSALSGFFAGRHDNVTLMLAQFAGAGVNALLDWGLIFGKWGLPELGMGGAAWATVIGHLVIVGILGAVFLRRRHRREFGTWEDRPVDWALMGRIARFGFPNGVRFVIEIMAWTAFMLIIGRLGELELAASNIVWRINGMAFFPVIGLTTAVAMLVGQAQGAGRPDDSARVAWRGLAIAEVWMVSAAVLFVVTPRALVGMFLGESGVGAGEYEELQRVCGVLLWFVAAYCVVDAVNMVFMAALQGAGDTRGLLIGSGAMHGAYLVALLVIGWLGGGLYVFWGAAMVFIVLLAVVWLVRFRGGRWREMRVIEQGVPELEAVMRE